MTRLLRTFLAPLALAAAVFTAGAPRAGGAPAEAGEYEIKAVFLFNFLQFVDWPPAAFAAPGSDLVIGVLGADPFGQLLERTVAGEKVGGRQIRIERYRRVEDVRGCHVLFVAQSESARLPAILAAVAGRSVLTVGEFEGFATNGGIVRFLKEDDRIRFRINVDAAKAAGLTISSKLLRPAQIVRKGD